MGFSGLLECAPFSRLCGFLMRNSNTLFWLALLLFAGFLFYLLTPVLTPFLLATLLAYLGDPLVDRLQRWRMSRRTSPSSVRSSAVSRGFFSIPLL